MSKSVLVIDTPENCMQCPLFDGADECIMQDDNTNFNADTIDELMQTCPLMDLPEKDMGTYPVNTVDAGYAEGWNTCLDEIMGETK